MPGFGGSVSPPISVVPRVIESAESFDERRRKIMLRQTAQVIVRTDEEQGFVFIEQPDDDGTSTVVVAPDQIPLLIQWLQEAKAEADVLEKKHSQKT